MIFHLNLILKGLLWLFLFFLIFLPSVSHATPEYAQETGFSCDACHIDGNGGKLTKEGETYRENLKAKGLYRPLTTIQKLVRLLLGYLHLLTAIAWFGTIFYVHLLLKPSYAAKGLPKGELLLGWIGIIILSITGTLLTISRLPAFMMFYTTRFGILLGIKIILFMIMVATAAVVIFLIGPKMRKSRALSLPKDKKRLTSEEFSHFDGREGRPAYFAYKGKVYDVTSSMLWKNGTHMKKHAAGNDLTDMINKAPHGEEKVFQMPEIGELLPIGRTREKSPHEKVFYFMAYMNLIFVFLITFIIALWRWS